MANQITQIRTLLKCSQAELAGMLGVDRSTVTRMENGTAEISTLHELALAELARRRRAKTPSSKAA